MITPSDYIELRNDSYYIAGNRIGLDLVVHEFRNGRSAEAILEAYPSTGSHAKVYGAITFIMEQPAEIEAYLAGQERVYEKFQAENPLPPEMIRRFERTSRSHDEAWVSFRSG